MLAWYASTVTWRLSIRWTWRGVRGRPGRLWRRQRSTDCQCRWPPNHRRCILHGMVLPSCPQCRVHNNPSARDKEIRTYDRSLDRASRILFWRNTGIHWQNRLRRRNAQLQNNKNLYNLTLCSALISAVGALIPTVVYSFQMRAWRFFLTRTRVASTAVTFFWKSIKISYNTDETIVIRCFGHSQHL